MKTDVVIASINRNKPDFMDQEELVYLLKHPESVESYHPHLQAFFSECSTQLIEQFLAENGLTFDDLDSAYQQAIKPFLGLNEERIQWIKSHAGMGASPTA